MTYVELQLEMLEMERKLRVARAAMYHATSVLAQTQGDYRSLPVKNAPDWVGGLRECEALLGCALIDMNSGNLCDESSDVELSDDTMTA